MGYAILTDKDRALGDINISAYTDVIQAMRQYGGPVLKQFALDGGTDKLDEAKKEMSVLIQNKQVAQLTRVSLYQLLNAMRKAVTYVMIGM